MDLEGVWKYREAEIYPALFGKKRRGIFALTAEPFRAQFKNVIIDPAWLQCGVFEFAPTPARRSWMYVTSGLSNPWAADPKDYDASKPSGHGLEFTLQTSEQGDWAIAALLSALALEILLGNGRIAGKGALAPNQIVNLGGPINGKPDCLIDALVVTRAEIAPDTFKMPSGTVLLAGFSGITAAERASVKTAADMPALLERLRDAGYHSVINPKRRSLV